MSSNGQFAIETRGLTKQFGKAQAVHDLSFCVPYGTTLGLLGPNGAGKSTTLRMLMGMLRPTTGTAKVFGRDVIRQGPEIKQHVGYVPESHHVYRWMTVEAAVQFAKAMYGSWNDELSSDLLDLFRLPSKRRVRALSKGMLAKLSLLIALAHEPELLILDEPMSGLDPIARDDFIEGVLRGICVENRTVVFSTHQLDEVNRLADSVAIMNAGQILVQGPMEDLLHSARRVRAVLTDGRLPECAPDGTIWQQLNRREWLLTIHPFSGDAVEQLRRQNPIENVDVSSLSLDDLFRDFIRGAAAC